MVCLSSCAPFLNSGEKEDNLSLSEESKALLVDCLQAAVSGMEEPETGSLWKGSFEELNNSEGGIGEDELPPPTDSEDDDGTPIQQPVFKPPNTKKRTTNTPTATRRS